MARSWRIWRCLAQRLARNQQKETERRPLDSAALRSPRILAKEADARHQQGQQQALPVQLYLQCAL